MPLQLAGPVSQLAGPVFQLTGPVSELGLCSVIIIIRGHWLNPHRSKIGYYQSGVTIKTTSLEVSKEQNLFFNIHITLIDLELNTLFDF